MHRGNNKSSIINNKSKKVNFLAHILLSGDDEELMVGNFIADSIKGSELPILSPRVKDGVMLHREIDEFTDNHPVFQQSKTRVRSEMHKFTGVVMDIFYDHFLAKNFSAFSAVPLVEFVEKTYKTLQYHTPLLPPSAQYVIPIMIRNNWLEAYADINELQPIFNGMSRRTTFNSNMQQAVDSLRKHYIELEEDFGKFFPEAVKFVESKIK